ncbi:MAG: nicotinate-nucleotide adenylyltransferase [Candidatus Competibacterales bacterium]
MSRRPPIALLGGTFDPIHYGHLRSALELIDLLGLAEVRFTPSATPPHRDQPKALAVHRRAMVALAIEGQSGFVLDDRELGRQGPSYTVDTLKDLRRELPDAPLCLLLGEDAFISLDQWSRWEQLLTLSHIVVVRRPGSELRLDALSPALAKRIAPILGEDPGVLQQTPAGQVVIQAVTQLAISATLIRQLLAAGRSPRFLLPDAVLHYIHARGLYGVPPKAPLEER